MVCLHGILPLITFMDDMLWATCPQGGVLLKSKKEELDLATKRAWQQDFYFKQSAHGSFEHAAKIHRL